MLSGKPPNQNTKMLRKIYIFILLIAFGTPASAQIRISGQVDSIMRKQGKWIYQYDEHVLIPLQKAWVIANYVNDTLEGEYKLISDDSTYRYFFTFKSNLPYGYAYLLEKKRLSKTFYYDQNGVCMVSEFDNKGRVFRSYTMKNDVIDGIYLGFDKGKIVVKRQYDMGGIKKEEINTIVKKNKS